MILRWVRRLFQAALLVMLGCVLAGIALFLQIREEVEMLYAGEIAGMDGYRPPVAVEVFDRNGRKIDSFAAERRLWVPLAELPPHVWQAFLAAEDRRFMDHPGVDLAAIARAMTVNLQAGEIKEGGSTITQQLAKNLVTGNEKSYTRKIKEALVAMELERQLSKEQLLELYINQVYLGAGSYGVEAAAQRYFQKPASMLTAGQAAMIAGLIPAPSLYNPERNPHLAARRRQEVLLSMLEESWVNGVDAVDYLDDPVRYTTRPPRDDLPGTGYKTMVRRELRRLFGNDRLFAEGLKVYTPYDEDVQRVAEQAVWSATEGVQKRQGFGGPLAHIPKEQRAAWLASGEGLRKDDDGRPLPPEPGECFQAMVINGLGKLQAGPMTWSMRSADRGLRVRASALHGGGSLAGSVRAGDIVGVCRPADGGKIGEVAYDRTPWAESAIVVLDNKTGGVVALVGGKDEELEGFVRAVQGRRQPGSTMKIYVYGTALRLGHNQLDVIQDAPIAFPGTNGKMWAPRNYDGGFFGPMLYRVALAYSRNVPAVRIALEVGTHEIIETARALGVRSPIRDDYTIALGSSEMTPMDQAIAFSTVARLGEHRDPVFIRELRDMDDRLLGVAGQPVALDDGTTVLLPGAGEQVMEPGVAYELADMLGAVMQIGTGVAAAVPDHRRYGKTGTTNNWTDAWFVGFNPDYTAAVWVGTDTPVPLGEKETGSKAAMPAWKMVMDALGTPSLPALPLPPDAVQYPHEQGYLGMARRNLPEGLLHRARIGEAPLPRFPAPWPTLASEAARSDAVGSTDAVSDADLLDGEDEAAPAEKGVTPPEEAAVETAPAPARATTAPAPRKAPAARPVVTKPTAEERRKQERQERKELRIERRESNRRRREVDHDR